MRPHPLPLTQTQALSSVAPHRFLANKFASLQTTAHLVLVLELCPNGDLFDLIQRQPQVRRPPFYMPLRRRSR